MQPNQSQVAARLQVGTTSNERPNRDASRPLAACESELNLTLSRARKMLKEMEYVKSGNAMERFNVSMVEHPIEDLEIIDRGLKQQ